MATATEATDKQILSKLRRRKTPATAAELGTTTIRLRKLDEHVEVVGQRRGAGRGRPALLFAAKNPLDS